MTKQIYYDFSTNFYAMGLYLRVEETLFADKQKTHFFFFFATKFSNNMHYKKKKSHYVPLVDYNTKVKEIIIIPKLHFPRYKKFIQYYE